MVLLLYYMSLSTQIYKIKPTCTKGYLKSWGHLQNSRFKFATLCE